MAHVAIVANETGTVLRKLNMTGHTVSAVDKAATSMESIICEDREIVHVEVDYDGCVIDTLKEWD